jgi:hypothetical protein
VSSSGVRKALDKLIGKRIVVPVWTRAADGQQGRLIT